MMKTILLFISIGVLLSCSGPDKNGTKPKITTTTMMIYDAVKNLVGDSAEVDYIMGPGVDPHVYKASQGDLKLLTQADLIVYHGLHLEGKMGEILEQTGRLKPTIALGETVDSSYLLFPAGETTAPDPHIWFDVALWHKAVRRTSEELIKIYPQFEPMIRQNMDLISREYDSLDNWVRRNINTVPKNQRILITAHDAFSYFGEAYDIEVRGLQGISTQSDYGLRDISNLVSFITERKIPAVFVEASVSERSIQAVVEGCRQKGHEIQIGGTLFTDSMGPLETAEGTYPGMVRFNVQTIVTALQ